VTASTSLAIPLALVFAALGAAKLLALAPMRERAAHVGLTTAAYRRIGVLEIAAAAGLLLGVTVPAVGGAAGAGLLLLLAGALIAHLRQRDRATAVAPAAVLGLAVLGYLILLAGTPA
jgi:hypothetical protein